MIDRFFWQTAWPMALPVPYSPFHIILTAAGVLISWAAARQCAASARLPSKSVLFSSGLLLAALELYKQGFLYQVVNGGRYNWWYFPFQLCSIPMYLGLLDPALSLAEDRQTAKQPQAASHPGLRFRTITATFLQDFGLLGGILALAVPDGLLHPYWTLTLHGFLWHFILIFLGIYCKRKGLADSSDRGFLRIVPLYLVCCGIAALINTAVQINIYPAGYADMFYINCFFPSEQPLFHQISLALGNVWGHLSYILASCAGAYLIHRLCRIL